MKLVRSTLLAAGVCAALSATPARADATDDFLRLMQRIGVQYTILTLRSFVDLTYDTITIEPQTNDLVISGMTLHPILDWDEEGRCVITIERAIAADVTSFETLQTMIELSGINIPSACLDPGVGSMAAGFGYEQLVVDNASIDLAYDLPSAGADLVIQASIKDAAELNLSAKFGYLWFNLPLDAGPADEPIPVAQLETLELAIENRGLWDRVEPMIVAQAGDTSALPQMAQLVVSQALSEGGTRTPSADEQAFVANLTAELERFLTEKNRLVITAAPEGGVWLSEDSFGAPYQMIADFKPEISSTPIAYRALIQPEELAAALAGDALDEDARLRVGEALLTGIGAPRALAEGAALLNPLADQWQSKASRLLAEARAETGDTAGAYSMALRAMAGGDRSAVGLADELEAALGLSSVLEAQALARTEWPNARAQEAEGESAVSAGDLGLMRSMAYAASIGRDQPRSYAHAYFWASLAAAGGDGGAANLRRRLDTRFADAGEAWRQVADAEASRALTVWTRGGLGARIADRVR